MSTFQPVGPGLPNICVEVDVTTNPMTGSRVWTDITPNVRSLDYINSGRSTELQRSATGSATVLCGDIGDAVSRLGVRKRQWLRVQSQWQGTTYPEWQGIIEQVSRKWPAAGHDATLELRAADVFKVLRALDLGGQSFPSQRNDQRVAAICALAGLTFVGTDTDTDTADATAVYNVGTDALSTAMAVEESENGLLIATQSGTIDFQGRHWRFRNAATSQATFGEAAAQIPYKDSTEYDDDDALIANVAIVTPLGGTAVTYSDAASIQQYWATTIQRNLVSSSTGLASSAAQWLVNRYKNPTPRLPSIEVNLAAVNAAGPSLVTKLVNSVNSQRFTWRRNDPTPISMDVFIEQIEVSIRPGSWDMKFELSPAVGLDNSGWVLDSATNSILDSTTVLVY